MDKEKPKKGTGYAGRYAGYAGLGLFGGFIIFSIAKATVLDFDRFYEYAAFCAGVFIIISIVLGWVGGLIGGGITKKWWGAIIGCVVLSVAVNYFFYYSFFWEHPGKYNPAWSPDGSQIAYLSCCQHQKYGISVMNADGSNQTWLTESIEYGIYDWVKPRWSPDGVKIAFTSSRQDFTNEIYVIDKDGNNLTRLISGVTDSFFAWSPDGTKIAFDIYSNIYVMDVDGNNVIQLTFNDNYNSNPTWAPDSYQIAYRSCCWPESIYLTNIDGSNHTALLEDGSYPSWSPDGTRMSFSPSWSPDGTIIAFSIYGDIYVLELDGNNLMQITNAIKIDYEIFWAPDSKRIAFTSSEEKKYDVYVIDIDGSNLIRLTDEAISQPSWSPDGMKITFELDNEIYIINADGSGKTCLTCE